MEDQRPRVGLTDAVQAVRRELLAAAVDAGSEEVRFALGSVELEFAIDFRPAADGRVQVLVLQADADESAQPVAIHRLRLTLDLQEIAGETVKIRRGIQGDPLIDRSRDFVPARPWAPPPERREREPREPSREPRGLGGDRPGDRGLGGCGDG